MIKLRGTYPAIVAGMIAVCASVAGCGNSSTTPAPSQRPSTSATPSFHPDIPAKLQLSLTPTAGGTGTTVTVIVLGAPPNVGGEPILCGLAADGSRQTTPDTVCDAGGGIAEQADSIGFLNVPYTIATHLTPSAKYAVFFLDSNGKVMAQAPFAYTTG